MSPRARRLLAIGFVVAAVVAGSLVRDHLQLELSPASVRDAVQGFGFWGPVVFVLMIAFRLVLLIPSQIMLVAAGICFGFVKGTLYGTLGVTLSGIIAFALARMMGGDSVAQRVPPRMARIFRGASRGGGAVLVTAGTGYPIGPMTAFHIGAGLTAMPIMLYLAALLIGSLIRALLFTYLGSSIVEGGLAASWPALIPIGLLLIPLAHRPTRIRVANLFLGED